MRKILIVFMAFVSAFSLAKAQGESGWRLVWADEFDVDGEPSAADWGYERGFVRNEEPQWYQPQNAVCRDGNLVITAKVEKVANPQYDKNSRWWQRNRPFARYTSASLNTAGKHELRYGRIEVRAKIPVTDGSWPAIWCLGNKDRNGSWPACGEVDILEFYNHCLLANACWSDAEGRSQWDTMKKPFSQFTSTPDEWASEYHVWRMDWDSLEIKLYLDGKLMNVTRLEDTTQPVGEFCKVENPFKTPMYLLLNLALRTEDHIDESKFPLKYYIDYVRFYKRK